MMNDLLHLQIGLTLWLQSISPALDPIFQGINLLQTQEFYLLALPIVWWCIDKRIGSSLVILFLSSDYIVRVLKGLTSVPRPYQLDPRVRSLDPQPDASFPSAGTMTAVILWGYLATQFRRRVLWVWAVAAIMLVALARVYLGAHYPTDVIASILIGATILALVLGSNLAQTIATAPHAGQWFMAIVWPVALAFIYLNGETAVTLGAMLGFGVGVLLEDRFVHFDPHGTAWKQLLKLALGLVVGLGLRFAIKPLLPLGNVSDIARYAVIGLWLGAGAPGTFVLMRLAKQRERTSLV